MDGSVAARYRQPAAPEEAQGIHGLMLYSDGAASMQMAQTLGPPADILSPHHAQLRDFEPAQPLGTGATLYSNDLLESLQGDVLAELAAALGHHASHDTVTDATCKMTIPVDDRQPTDHSAWVSPATTFLGDTTSQLNEAANDGSGGPFPHVPMQHQHHPHQHQHHQLNEHQHEPAATWSGHRPCHQSADPAMPLDDTSGNGQADLTASVLQPPDDLPGLYSSVPDAAACHTGSELWLARGELGLGATVLTGPGLAQVLTAGGNSSAALPASGPAIAIAGPPAAAAAPEAAASEVAAADAATPTPDGDSGIQMSGGTGTVVQQLQQLQQAAAPVTSASEPHAMEGPKSAAPGTTPGSAQPGGVAPAVAGGPGGQEPAPAVAVAQSAALVHRAPTIASLRRMMTSATQSAAAASSAPTSALTSAAHTGSSIAPTSALPCGSASAAHAPAAAGSPAGTADHSAIATANPSPGPTTSQLQPEARLPGVLLGPVPSLVSAVASFGGSSEHSGRHPTPAAAAAGLALPSHDAAQGGSLSPGTQVACLVGSVLDARAESGGGGGAHASGLGLGPGPGLAPTDEAPTLHDLPSLLAANPEELAAAIAAAVEAVAAATRATTEAVAAGQQQPQPQGALQQGQPLQPVAQQVLLQAAPGASGQMQLYVTPSGGVEDLAAQPPSYYQTHPSATQLQYPYGQTGAPQQPPPGTVLQVVAYGSGGLAAVPLVSEAAIPPAAAALLGNAAAPQSQYGDVRQVTWVSAGDAPAAAAYHLTSGAVGYQYADLMTAQEPVEYHPHPHPHPHPHSHRGPGQGQPPSAAYRYTPAPHDQNRNYDQWAPHQQPQPHPYPHPHQQQPYNHLHHQQYDNVAPGPQPTSHRPTPYIYRHPEGRGSNPGPYDARGAAYEHDPYEYNRYGTWREREAPLRRDPRQGSEGGWRGPVRRPEPFPGVHPLGHPTEQDSHPHNPHHPQHQPRPWSPSSVLYTPIHDLYTPTRDDADAGGEYDSPSRQAEAEAEGRDGAVRHSAPAALAAREGGSGEEQGEPGSNQSPAAAATAAAISAAAAALEAIEARRRAGRAQTKGQASCPVPGKSQGPGPGQDAGDAAIEPQPSGAAEPGAGGAGHAPPHPDRSSSPSQSSPPPQQQPQQAHPRQEQLQPQQPQPQQRPVPGVLSRAVVAGDALGLKPLGRDKVQARAEQEAATQVMLEKARRLREQQQQERERQERLRKDQEEERLRERLQERLREQQKAKTGSGSAALSAKAAKVGSNDNDKAGMRPTGVATGGKAAVTGPGITNPAIACIDAAGLGGAGSGAGGEGDPVDLEMELEHLEERIATAPTYGMNARALVLRAAELVARREAGRQSVPPTAAAEASAAVKPAAAAVAAAADPGAGLISLVKPLADAVPVPERAFVTYVPRSSIPRLIRQETAHVLTGGYLALALQRARVPEARAVQAVSSEPDLRKAAVAAAGQHEMVIYRQVTSKMNYELLARKTKAEPERLQLSDELVQLLTQRYGGSGGGKGPTSAAAASPAGAAKVAAAGGVGPLAPSAKTTGAVVMPGTKRRIPPAGVPVTALVTAKTGLPAVRTGGGAPAAAASTLGKRPSAPPLAKSSVAVAADTTDTRKAAKGPSPAAKAGIPKAGIPKAAGGGPGSGSQSPERAGDPEPGDPALDALFSDSASDSEGELAGSGPAGDDDGGLKAVAAAAMAPAGADGQGRTDNFSGGGGGGGSGGSDGTGAATAVGAVDVGGAAAAATAAATVNVGAECEAPYGSLFGSDTESGLDDLDGRSLEPRTKGAAAASKGAEIESKGAQAARRAPGGSTGKEVAAVAAPAEVMLVVRQPADAGSAAAAVAAAATTLDDAKGSQQQQQQPRPPRHAEPADTAGDQAKVKPTAKNAPCEEEQQRGRNEGREKRRRSRSRSRGGEKARRRDKPSATAADGRSEGRADASRAREAAPAVAMAPPPAAANGSSRSAARRPGARSGDFDFAPLSGPPEGLEGTVHIADIADTAPSRAGSEALGERELSEPRQKLRQQVLAFIHATLEPLYRAGLLGKEPYKRVAAKTTERLMAAHPDDTTADFLVREHAQVSKFIMKVVEREQQREAELQEQQQQRLAPAQQQQ